MEKPKSPVTAPRKPKLFRYLLVTGFIVLVAFLVWKFLLAPRNGSVQTIKVQRGTISEELILSGEVKAEKYAKLQFQTSGEIAYVKIKEGDWVKKGQILAGLDTTNLVADLERARYDLVDTEATLARVYDEVKGHDTDETYTMRETRTTAEVAKNKAYHAILKAEENLRNATLKAPFDGLVTYIAHPAPGINIIYTEPQVEILDPETIYFEVTADQNEITTLKSHLPATIVLDSFPDEELAGEISYLGYTPKSGEIGTAYSIKVLFPSLSSTETLRIGMTGDAHFTLSQKDNVLFAPPRFINSDANGKYVNLNRKNHKVYIETGIEGEDKTEIIGDIKEGDTLYD